MSDDCECKWLSIFVCSFQVKPDWSYPISLIQSLTFEISSSFLISGPRTSPANTTLLVVVSVSQATLDKDHQKGKYQLPYQKFYLKLYLDDLQTDSLVKRKFFKLLISDFIK